MSSGFCRAGGRPVFAVEIDSAAAATYRLNFGSHVFANDISQVATFPVADLIIGGPPCQGFSQLGRKDPDDPRNFLWEHYARAIGQVKPAVFVMENVPQLLRSDHYENFKTGVGSLDGVEYRICEGVLDASLYGIPQRRKRAFVIGSRVGVPSLPEPTSERETVDEAIGDLPLEPTGEDWHIGRNPTELSLKRYRCIKQGGNHYDLPDELKTPCWRKKKTGTTDVLGRLRGNEPSCTIRTEFFKPEKGRYLHPHADRPITHREAARLQTFQDDFRFYGSKIQVARQIGNAVPVRLATSIAGHVFAHLAESGYEPLEVTEVLVDEDAEVWPPEESVLSA